MQFKISKELLEQINSLILENNEKELHDLLHELHYADIAEIMEELDEDGARYVFNTLDSEKPARRSASRRSEPPGPGPRAAPRAPTQSLISPRRKPQG